MYWDLFHVLTHIVLILCTMISQSAFYGRLKAALKHLLCWCLILWKIIKNHECKNSCKRTYENCITLVTCMIPNFKLANHDPSQDRLLLTAISAHDANVLAQLTGILSFLPHLTVSYGRQSMPLSPVTLYYLCVNVST